MLTIWIVVCIAALVIEILTPTALVSIWFSVGAIAAAICTMLGLSVTIQVVVCILVSVAFIFLARPVALRYLRGNIVPTNADRLIGENAIVLEAIQEDTWGKVKVRGVEWSAVSTNKQPISEGKHVRIDAIEGAKLLVHEIEQ